MKINLQKIEVVNAVVLTLQFDAPEDMEIAFQSISKAAQQGDISIRFKVDEEQKR